VRIAQTRSGTVIAVAVSSVMNVGRISSSTVAMVATVLIAAWIVSKKARAKQGTAFGVGTTIVLDV